MTEMDYLVQKLFSLADEREPDRLGYAERVCEILGRVGFSKSAQALVLLHLAHPEVQTPMAKPGGQADPLRAGLCFGLALPWRPAALWLKAHGHPINAGQLCRVFRAELMGRYRVAATHAELRSFRWICGTELVAIGEQRADALAKAAERWAAGLAGSSAPSAEDPAASAARCCAALRPEFKEGIDLFSSIPQNQGRNTPAAAGPSTSSAPSAEDPAAVERSPILGLPNAIWDPGLTDDQVHAMALKWWRTFLPKGHNPADFLGAILAARVLAKGPQEKYLNTCLAKGLRADWKRKAAELIKKHEDRRKMAADPISPEESEKRRQAYLRRGLAASGDKRPS